MLPHTNCARASKWTQFILHIPGWWNKEAQFYYFAQNTQKAQTTQVQKNTRDEPILNSFLPLHSILQVIAFFLSFISFLLQEHEEKPAKKNRLSTAHWQQEQKKKSFFFFRRTSFEHPNAAYPEEKKKKEKGARKSSRTCFFLTCWTAKKKKIVSFFTDTQTDMLAGLPASATCVQRFDDSRVLQFALRIAFCCVLHRCGSRDIHRHEL